MKLTRAEQATLFLYLTQKGIPAWGDGPDGQAKVFAMLLQKSVKWAKKSLELAKNAGYAEKVA